MLDSVIMRPINTHSKIIIIITTNQLTHPHTPLPPIFNSDDDDDDDDQLNITHTHTYISYIIDISQKKNRKPYLIKLWQL